MINLARDVHAAVARAVLLRSFPACLVDEPERVAFTLRFVDEQIAGSSTVMRFGVQVTACMLALALLAINHVDVRSGASPMVSAALSWWIDRPWPVLAEYARLVRSLALVAWFDAPISVA